MDRERAQFTAISYWRPDQVRHRRRPSLGVPPPGVVHAGQFTAVDDQGIGYQFGVSVGPIHTEWSGQLQLHPGPPHGIRWLDLSPAPGEPATRIELGSAPASPPEITVTPAAVEPGELLLTNIAAGLLALASPEQVPLHPSAGRPGPLSEAAGGLADIITALQAAGALTGSSACTTESAASSCTCWPAASRRNTPGRTARSTTACPSSGYATPLAAGIPRAQDNRVRCGIPTLP
jgi:hypothetical protein